jgi:hypothetical protein
MADSKDKGSVEIDVTVDASDAIAGFDKAGQAAQEMGKDVKKLDDIIDDAKETNKRLNKTVRKETDSTAKVVRKTGGKMVDVMEQYNKVLARTNSTTKKIKPIMPGIMRQHMNVLGQIKPSGVSTSPIGDSLPKPDDIEGLARFRDATGEADSAMAGMAAAADHLSPALANNMRLIGDTSGFMEAATRGTALFGGSMRSLLNVALPVAGAIGALSFAYVKLSGNLKSANKRIKESHEKMLKTKASADSYKASMRNLRLELGILNKTEVVSAEAKEKAKKDMEGLNLNIDEARAKYDALNKAVELNNEALETGAKTGPYGGASFKKQFVTANDALKTTELNLKGVAAGFTAISVQGSASGKVIEGMTPHQSAQNRALEKATKIQKEVIRERDRQKRGLEKLLAVQKDRAAQETINSAIQEGSLKRLKEAAPLLDDLKKKELARIKPILETAIATKEAEIAAEEAEKSEAERDKSRKRREDRAAKAKAERERLESELAKSAARRLEVEQLLAKATGDAALIEFDYAQQIKHVNDLFKEGAATGAERQKLLDSLNAQQKKAIAELSKVDHERIASEAIARRELMKGKASETQAIEEQLKLRIAAIKNNQAEELGALKEKLEEGKLTQGDFYSQEVALFAEHSDAIERATKEAEDEKTRIEEKASEDRIKNSLEETRAKLDNAGAFAQEFNKLFSTALQKRTQDLAQEEAAALKIAEGDLEAQDKIKEEYAKRREKELKSLFQMQKATAISVAIIQGAQAAINALAPVASGGFGPALGSVMAPIIAATTAAQVALIAKQEPKFHEGGIVGGNGDRAITAQGGEVVLNRDTVSALGGPDAANSLNQGGGFGSPVVVQMTYKQRVFDQIVVDNIAKGGPLRNALNQAAANGKRGRIGGML